MRFLVDACAGQAVASVLRNQGHDVVFVGVSNPKMKDALILEWAVREQRIVVTTGKDFEEMVYRQDKPHAGIVRLANAFRTGLPSCNTCSYTTPQLSVLGSS